MTDDRALAELIARVEKAAGPDRELDALVAAALRICPEFDPSIMAEGFSAECVGGHDGRVTVYPKKDGERFYPYIARMADDYTSSLDAVVALVEREMAGCSWTASNYCGAFVHYRGRMWSETEKTGSPALALLLAFLKAKAKT